MRKRITILAIASSMLFMPNAHADSKITIDIKSKYIKSIDRKTLNDYLDILGEFYPIYQGTYHIYIRDYLPTTIKFPPKAAGGHVAGATAFIDAKAFKKLNLDIYYGITHELAEMAVNPNVDKYYDNGDPYEICDDINAYFIINGHWAADFKKP